MSMRRSLLLLIRAVVFLTVAQVCSGGPSFAVAGDDVPTAFSEQVSAAVGDWRAQDWRRGVIKLHPSKFTWQSNSFLELIAEEPVAGRPAQKVLEGYFAATEVDDHRVDMLGAKELAPGVLARSYRWEFAFDSNLGLWGVVTTQANTYVGFSAVCEMAHPESYVGEDCVKKVLALLLLVQSGKLKMPEPPTPLNVPGWEGQYLFDGTSVITNASSNGLRRATIYASPPAVIEAAQLRASIERFAAATVEADDGAPGPLSWVGKSADEPWIRRQFPQAFEGPSIQMTGSVRLPDQRVALVSVRCPNDGWLKTCAFGVSQTVQALGSGEVEKRRPKVIAATQAAPPANGLKNAQILGIYTEGRNTVGTGGFMTGFSIDGHLYLRDGTVMRDFDVAPAYVDVAGSRKKNPERWGRWRQSGKAVTVTWHDGAADTVEVSGENLMIGGSLGMRLQGHYRHAKGGGTIVFGGGSSYFAESNYTFYADGTFSSGGSSSFIAGPGPGGGETAIALGGSQKAAARGRYAIDGYTMTLSYPDGRLARLSFAAYAHEIDKPNRQGVMLNGTYYFLDAGK
jgi:hypothetical protein